MIRVLIVEDLPVEQARLDHMLSSDPGIHVIGTANNRAVSIKFLKRLKPDVIAMDMPVLEMSGYETVRGIMETYPVPIVIVSSYYDRADAVKIFRALEAGAVAVVEKPPGMGRPFLEEAAKKLVETVKMMSEVKVVTRRFRPRQAEVAASRLEVEPERTPTDIRCVAVGVSTGGPPVIQTILSGLSKDFPAPVLIVQHIAAGFLQGMVEWLGQATGFPVHIASHGDYSLPGHVYFAPDGFQMGVESSGRIVLGKNKKVDGLCPSVAYLFLSVAKAFGPDAVGVLLTGMGSDGAEELRFMKEKGAVTIAQDKVSSAVHGMPGEAIKLGAATYVLPPDKIASTLGVLASKRRTNAPR